EAQRQYRAGADRGEKLRHREARCGSHCRGEFGIGQHRFEDLGEKHDAGPEWLPRKMPGEGRMVVGDLQRDRVHSGVFDALVAKRVAMPWPCAGCRSASAASRSAGNLPVASRGKAARWTMRRGRNAASTRKRSAARMASLDTPGATTKATRRATGSLSRSGGIQNAPSITPSIAFRW